MFLCSNNNTQPLLRRLLCLSRPRPAPLTAHNKNPSPPQTAHRDATDMHAGVAHSIHPFRPDVDVDSGKNRTGLSRIPICNMLRCGRESGTPGDSRVAERGVYRSIEIDKMHLPRPSRPGVHGWVHLPECMRSSLTLHTSFTVCTIKTAIPGLVAT